MALNHCSIQPNHITKLKKKNKGAINTYLVNENHPPIIPEEQWELVQRELVRRRKRSSGDNKRYNASGKLICSKCGSTLKRRVWNSGKPSQKVVWQCSKYIQEGKNACEGTSIPDDLIAELDIKEEIVIKEWTVNGKKDYMYSSNSGSCK